MRRLINRAAALALCVAVALGATATAGVAAEPPAPKATGKLTTLSPASRQVLTGKVRRSEAGQQQPPAGAPVPPSSFFKSTRGKITLALMAGGIGFTIWSINHDRKPVKSPIR